MSTTLPVCTTIFTQLNMCFTANRVTSSVLENVLRTIVNVPANVPFFLSIKNGTFTRTFANQPFQIFHICSSNKKMECFFFLKCLNILSAEYHFICVSLCIIFNNNLYSIAILLYNLHQ